MGGAYLTLLNTVANLGVTLPKLFIFAGRLAGGLSVLVCIGRIVDVFCWSFQSSPRHVVTAGWPGGGGGAPDAAPGC